MSIQAMTQGLFANRFVNRIAHKTTFAVTMALCLMWSGAHALFTPATPVASSTPFHEWPREWDGAPLRPLALSAVEQRFADQFPGSMTRMTDGMQTLVLREVRTPTRMLHPATDCYRALGYRIDNARLERDAQQRMWRCFTAARTGTPTLRVCERIVDSQGIAFTDTSAWYWEAAAGRSEGPWQAVTLARAFD